MTLLDVQNLVVHYDQSSSNGLPWDRLRGVIPSSRRHVPLPVQPAESHSVARLNGDPASEANGVVRAVDGISFTIARGEMFALVGESGCGKTSTALSILQLLEVGTGDVVFDGTNLATLRRPKLRKYRRLMQVIYQDPYESLDPRCRVKDIVEEPLRVHGIGSTSRARREMITDTLSRVELSPPERFLDRYPHELSGGQRQRVAIAAAIVLNPQLLVADEPVSMLDVSVRAGVMTLLRGLCEDDGMAILIITHDLAVASRFADRIAVMYLGKIVESGTARDVLRHPAHPYTQALCDVSPRRHDVPSSASRQIVVGEPPNAAAVPAGCRFHPRCKFAHDRCQVEEPQLKVLTSSATGQQAACFLVE